MVKRYRGRKKKGGWYGDSYRHSLAARGIGTVRKYCGKYALAVVACYLYAVWCRWSVDCDWNCVNGIKEIMPINFEG